MPMSSGQTWDPAAYARNARFVSDLGAPVLALLAPKAGERILDLGCGGGRHAFEALRRGATVIALDYSFDELVFGVVRPANAEGVTK